MHGGGRRKAISISVDWHCHSVVCLRGAAEQNADITATMSGRFSTSTSTPPSSGSGIVVGYVDERGSWVVGHGKLDNGTEQEVDGDTIFEIGSVTKTFTALLLEDMVARGQMRFDDPVAKFLPDSVTCRVALENRLRS